MNELTPEEIQSAQDRALDRCIHITDVVERSSAIRLAMFEEGFALARKAPSFDCIVPWLDDRPLINAVGSSEVECQANLALVDLSDEDAQRVVFKKGRLSLT